mmetsp:Transcript_2355/g.4254  ORF Transcript_2355/g.4254 Transcript_2355/m.4254 type:complete len:715 (-) Transcript_2355:10-2154(-)
MVDRPPGLESWCPACQPEPPEPECFPEACGSEQEFDVRSDDDDQLASMHPPGLGKERLWEEIPCTEGGRQPLESNFEHCPMLPSFVRCGPHHRAELCGVLSREDIDRLQDIWWRYQDDLTWPSYDEKPKFLPRDFDTFYSIAQKVVDAMIDEYKVPMVLDQATISNTNHVGHPPHADNVRFDSVWWRGKQIRKEDEVQAAQEGGYVLWRTEKTSFRSYSCTVALSDPNGYEGGEVQFFDTWGSKDPIASYKCAEGCGVAFCGCNRNIHAVTGVKSGFRLVFLIWTRPPDVRVPDQQAHVCYFRPGTGLGVWLTTADIKHCQALKSGRKEAWVAKEEGDGTCQCKTCRAERLKLAWKDCRPSQAAHPSSSSKSTPTTSAGSSPRTSTSGATSGHSEQSESPSREELTAPGVPEPSSPRTPPQAKPGQHCPLPPAEVLCGPHGRVRLPKVLSKNDIRVLYQIWQEHQDDLSNAWYESKPTFSQRQFKDFRRIAQKVVDEMSVKFKQTLVLDQAAVNSTNHRGHPPHADNVQFDSVWWEGRQIRQRDENIAAQEGAQVHWKLSKTAYRNYSATVALTQPDDYGGGDLEFFDSWGDKNPREAVRCKAGSGTAFCGCQKSIHAVKPVRWGFRLVLLIWTRPKNVEVSEDQTQVCYFRPGSGLSIWLTSADLLNYPEHEKKKLQWVPVRREKDEQVMIALDNDEASKADDEIAENCDVLL